MLEEGNVLRYLLTVRFRRVSSADDQSDPMSDLMTSQSHFDAIEDVIADLPHLELPLVTDGLEEQKTLRALTNC